MHVVSDCIYNDPCMSRPLTYEFGRRHPKLREIVSLGRIRKYYARDIIIHQLWMGRTKNASE